MSVAAILSAVPASAQQPKNSLLPWERDARRILQPSLPQEENPLDRRIDEALKRLGLPPQPKLDITEDAQPLPLPPGLSATVLPRLDRDRNGYVSRGEYFADRQRARVVGGRGTERYLHRQQRFDSRFRRADRNGDGRLSATEIDAMEGRRF